MIAVVAAVLIKVLIFTTPLVGISSLIEMTSIFLALVVRINILLAIFNFLPIPPLDGSKIFALLLPEREASAYLSIGTFGILIILLLLEFPIGGFSLGNLILSLLTFSQHLLGL